MMNTLMAPVPLVGTDWRHVAQNASWHLKQNGQRWRERRWTIHRANR